MRRRILLFGLFIMLIKLSFGRENYFAYADTTAPGDNIAMNYISYIPFADKISSEGVYIWPNPAKDKIIVYVNGFRENEQGECLVYNNDGTPVLMHPVRNGTNEIILGSIPDGIYIVSVDNKKKDIINKRFVVSK